MASTQPSSNGRQGAGLSRELIVATAREMIEAEGLGELSLRRLADRLGVTATALYKHVESKSDLLRSVAAGEFERFARHLEGGASPALPLDRLRWFARSYVDFARESPRLYPVLFLFPPNVEAGETTGELPSATDAFRYGLEPIRDAMDAGELEDRDPLLAGLTMWTAMHGAAEVALMGMGLGREREDQLIESLIECVIAGLRPKRGAGAS